MSIFYPIYAWTIAQNKTNTKEGRGRRFPKCFSDHHCPSLYHVIGTRQEKKIAKDFCIRRKAMTFTSETSLALKRKKLSFFNIHSSSSECEKVVGLWAFSFLLPFFHRACYLPRNKPACLWSLRGTHSLVLRIFYAFALLFLGALHISKLHGKLFRHLLHVFALLRTIFSTRTFPNLPTSLYNSNGCIITVLSSSCIFLNALYSIIRFYFDGFVEIKYFSRRNHYFSNKTHFIHA